MIWEKEEAKKNKRNKSEEKTGENKKGKRERDGGKRNVIKGIINKTDA